MFSLCKEWILALKSSANVMLLSVSPLAWIFPLRSTLSLALKPLTTPSNLRHTDSLAFLLKVFILCHIWITADNFLVEVKGNYHAPLHGTVQHNRST